MRINLPDIDKSFFYLDGRSDIYMKLVDMWEKYMIDDRIDE